MIRWALSLIGARARRDRLLLSATAVMVLISTTLLAAGPVYSDAMSTAGLQRRITDAPFARSGIAVEVRGPATSLGSVESSVDNVVDSSSFPTPVDRTTVTESPSFMFPSRLGLDDNIRTLISYREDLEGAVTVIEGRHAEQSDEVVIHTAALERTGLSVGDTIRLSPAGSGANPVSTTIVGAVEPTTASDSTWEGNEVGSSGVVESGGFVTLGPLWATADGFTTILGNVDSVIGIRLHPDPDGVTPANSPRLRSAASGFRGELESALPEELRLSSATELPLLLDEATRGLEVSRTTVILTVSQLAILSLYALVLAAGLLVESRAVETALLRSRGVNQGQLTLVAILEGLLVVLPGVLLGPAVATAVLGLMDSFGPLAAAGLELAPQISRQAFVFAAIGGVLCLIAMVGPARRQAAAYMEVRASVGRDRRAPIWQRTGLDIALVILAVVGLWQLRRYGGTFTSGATGQLRADPTLVAAPTVALIAAVVLSLRLIPLAGRIGERWARRSQALAAPLGSRQISRRPVYHTRSALLLTMAATIGLFTASFSGTWTDSQRDQARFSVPADMVVTPYVGPSQGLALHQMEAAYQSIDGIDDATAVIESNIRSDRLDEAASLIAIDTDALGTTFSIRDDLLDRPLEEVRTELADPEPRASFTLPDDTESLTLRVSDRTETEIEVARVRLSVVVRDGNGMSYSIPVTGPRPGEEQVELTALIRYRVDEITGTMKPPLGVVGLIIEAPTPVINPGTPSDEAIRAARRVVTIHEVTAHSTDGDSTMVASESSGWEVAPEAGVSYLDDPTVEVGDAGWLQAEVSPGAQPPSRRSVSFHARVPDLPADSALPAVATPSLLGEGDFQIGDVATFVTEGREVDVRFVAVANELPTLNGGGQGMLVDATYFQRLTLASAQGVLPPTGWNLALADEADPATVEGTLVGAPFNSLNVVGAEARSQELLNDPLALGMIGGLTIGLIAALAVAGVGLAAAAVVSARQRVGEFSLLQALGTSRRELARILAVENGFTILGSLLTGIVLGLGLAWLVLPSIAVSPSSVLVVPRPLVVIPWIAAGLLIVAGLVVVAVLSNTISGNLQHQDTASVLRLGEDV